jgi:prepilin-type N-terminal cleavage/methylation domain-containing protein
VRRRGRPAGFTIVELLVVVAILGILAVVSIRELRSNPVGDSARAIASLMSTAHRLAIAGGPVRADVAVDENVLGGRTMVEALVTEGGDTRLTVYQVVEGEGDGVYTLEPVQSISLHPDVTLFKVADSANLGLTAEAIETGGLPATKRYYPSGRADAYTLYLRHRTRENETRYRVVCMPFSPAPQVFTQW